MRARNQSPSASSMREGGVASEDGSALARIAAAPSLAEAAANELEYDRVALTFRSASGETTPVFQDLSFSIRPREFVTIIGPSGCGKSTLLMMTGGLLSPTAGEVRFQGAATNAPRPQQISIVFQDSCLLPWRTAVENVAFPLELRGVEKEERLARSREMLKLVRLDHAADRFPQELSGGMQQRVSIARGLVQNPAVLLMDEPFGALDEQTRLRMGDELLRIWEQVRSTVLFVTHSISEALYLSDRVIVLGSRNSGILLDLRVPFERPRTMDIQQTPEFNELRGQLWGLLREH